MAVGLSALQTVLEEGNKDDWFASPLIVRLAIVAVVSLTAFVATELSVEKPLVRLRLLNRRNFGVGVFVFVLIGFALFGSVYILPQYLGQAQGYSAEQISNVLAWTGLPQRILIPIVPLLMKRYDPRFIGFVGVSIFAASCFMNITLSADSAGDQLFIPNIVRAIGQALCSRRSARSRPQAFRRTRRAPLPACQTCCATSAARSARRRSRPS